MPIIIKSKNCYNTKNPKVKDKFNSISVGCKQLYLEKTLDKVICSGTIPVKDDMVKSFDYKKELSQTKLPDMETYSRTEHIYLETKTGYIEGSFRIPRSIDNQFVEHIDEYKHGETNDNRSTFSYRVKGKTITQNYKGYATEPYGSDEDDPQLKVVSMQPDGQEDITTGTITFPKLPETVTAKDTYLFDIKLTGLGDNSKVEITERKNYFLISYYLLCKYSSIYLNGDVYLEEDNVANMFGKRKEYIGQTVSFNVNGVVYELKLNETNLQYSVNSGEKPISVQSNDFLQTDNYYKQDQTNENLLQRNYEKTLTKYINGKESAEILCDINEYYDENGKLAISTKNQQYPMTFKNGDIVIPMVYSATGQDVPMSTYKDGTPKKFSVVGVEIIYDGATWQELTLQEYTE